MGFSEEELDNFREAAKVTAKARDLGLKKIKVGSKMVDVLDELDQHILDQGAKLAFPTQISMNDVAAHYCNADNDETEFTQEDIASLDLGAMVHGCPGDTARTFDLTPDKRFSELIAASKEALDSAIKLVKDGVYTSTLGREIHSQAKKFGFKPVVNLSGHGLSIRDLHTTPSIPNVDTKDAVELKDGMIIAIEPFITDGAGLVVEKGGPEVFMQHSKKPVRSPITRSVLKEIEKYEGMPFAKRYLDRKLGASKVNYALRDLYKNQILERFPPLVDKDGGKVAQSEHQLLVTEDGCEILTR